MSAPEIIIDKQAAGQRKLKALALGLVILLVGTALVVWLPGDPAKYGTIYITFASSLAGMVIGFMGGNAGEHLGKAVAAGKRLASMVGAAKPEAPKP